jgi:hypothetical protein
MKSLAGRIAIATIALLALSTIPARCAATPDAPAKSPGMRAAYGIGIIPEPKTVRLTSDEFRVNPQTTVFLDAAIADRKAVESIVDGVRKTAGFELQTVNSAGRSNTIVLEQVPATALTEIPAAHRSQESYTLNITKDRAIIKASHPQGLYYGAQSLLQLLAAGNGAARAGAIADWPDMNYRAIHVDLWYHQDRPWYYERLFQQLSHYKINAVVFEFEDKFQYAKHPVLSAPGAMNADEVKRLVRLARSYYIDFMPLVQTLGHINFIAKHPEFAPLRELPISAWQLCPLKPGSLELARDILDEIIDATEGTQYVHLGGDEAYELGRGDACRRKWGERAAIESYKMWLNFACDYVKQRGRTPIIWDDMILRHFQEADLKALPSKLIYMRWNYADNRLSEKEKMLVRAGLPVWIATAAQTMTPIWPDQRARVDNNAYLLQSASELGIKAELNTAWEDPGTHPETYWIGFAASAAYAWTSAKPTVGEFEDSFFRLFYGNEQSQLAKANATLSELGFLRQESAWAKPFGSLALPPVPDAGFQAKTDWKAKFGGLAEKAKQMRPRYQEAVDILIANLARNLDNRYSLEVELMCAKMQLHYTDLILRLNDIDDALLAAQADHAKGDDPAALERYYRAIRILEDLRYEKSLLYEETVKTWEKSTFPRDFRHIPGGRERYVYQADREYYYGSKSMDLTFVFEVEEKLGLFGYEQQIAATVQAILSRD